MSPDQPDLLDRLSGRAFEEFLERVLHDLGYTVELTQQTRDGGVDLFAMRHVNDISLKFVIEAKRCNKQRRVGITACCHRCALHVANPDVIY